MQKVIEVKNLSKVYGKRRARFTALKHLSLDIYKGESVAIVGKSGSGKSTLMHLLALLDKPTKGTIKVEGVNTAKMRPWKINRLRNRSFGFVFQQFFMNSNETVYENILLPLKIAHARRGNRKRLALDALKSVGLKERAKDKAGELSGGHKQRVCIARAIVNNPQFIFADEPTGNLDSATGEKIIQLLFDFNQRKGVTLVIVTHDEELAARCDRQVHLKDGEITKITKRKAKK